MDKDVELFKKELAKGTCGIAEYLLMFLDDFEGQTLSDARKHILSGVSLEIDAIILDMIKANEKNKKPSTTSQSSNQPKTR